MKFDLADNESMSEYDMDTDTFEANCKVFIYLMQGKRELEIAALDSIGLFVQSRDYPKGKWRC